MSKEDKKLMRNMAVRSKDKEVDLTYFEQMLSKEEFKLYGYGYNRGYAKGMVRTVVSWMFFTIVLLGIQLGAI